MYQFKVENYLLFLWHDINWKDMLWSDFDIMAPI